MWMSVGVIMYSLLTACNVFCCCCSNQLWCPRVWWDMVVVWLEVIMAWTSQWCQHMVEWWYVYVILVCRVHSCMPSCVGACISVCACLFSVMSICLMSDAARDVSWRHGHQLESTQHDATATAATTTIQYSTGPLWTYYCFPPTTVLKLI